MKRFRMNPVVRISLGLTIFVMTLLMVLEMLGFPPDPQKLVLDSRKKACESLAVYASMAIQKGDFEAIQTTIDILKQRNEDILSAALRRGDGIIMAMVGDHAAHWSNTAEKVSTLQNVLVPLYKGDLRWGTFEVSFADLHTNWLHSLWNRPLIKFLVIVLPLAFFGFFLIMKKILRHLDPSAIVPERVKLTLDSLVEGVVLMDHNERIVLVNKAFAENLGDGRTSLLGRKASDLKWQLPETLQDAEEYPWRQAIREGVSKSAVALHVRDQTGERRTFMVSGSPIIDADGKTRGALATFDDVTHIEAQNSKLQVMLGELKISRDKIRRQNEALQILATQDPLTECLNRRAFFERFEVEFSRARRYRHDLACIMTDIDHFKRINDEHGHQMGDEVLKKVSEILRTTVRDTDVVCRYGGEEFCLILTETGEKGAKITAERIRQAVCTDSIMGVPVTISLGVASLENSAANPSELINYADKALYRAKNSGRNQSIVFDATIDTEEEIDDKVRPQKPKEHAADTHIPQHVVKALIQALEHRDVTTAEHSRKVGDFCAAVARDLMPINNCALLEAAGQLHDIGKLGVPDAILHKPGPLTDAEWQVMDDHEHRSVDMIAATFMSTELAEIVKYHGHWYDGSSSKDPFEPRKEDLPLGARILHIANAFDAMTSHRPYREARTYAQAYEELRRCAGTQFDPKLVEHFIDVVRARDDSRREDASDLPNSIQLEIGRHVETLLAAVNTATWNYAKLSAGKLACLAEKYDLDAIASVSREVETAVRDNRGQIEMIELTSKLLGVCGSLRVKKNEKGIEEGHNRAA